MTRPEFLVLRGARLTDNIEQTSSMIFTLKTIVRFIAAHGFQFSLAARPTNAM
jgi:hypothetical protein